MLGIKRPARKLSVFWPPIGASGAMAHAPDYAKPFGRLCPPAPIVERIAPVGHFFSLNLNPT
jgi:hypothetical protein